MSVLASTTSACRSPIGVFDSGVGGLSVLRHIRERLPNESLLYFADSSFAPYGGRPESEVAARSVAIAEFLVAQGAKALVVACNTATAAAIAALRSRYPALPLVGVEPGLKPAMALTKTGVVGVLATERTLASSKFQLLRDQLAAADKVRFLLQPCPGLAVQVEKGELQSVATAALLQRFITPLIAEQADTLVLGCTHYPFVQPLVERIATDDGKRPIAIVDTGIAIARQLERLLVQHELRSTLPGPGDLLAYTTGSESSLASAFTRLLQQAPPVASVTA